MRNNVQQASVRICHITAHPMYDVRIFYHQCCSLVKAGYEVHLVIACKESGIMDGVHVHPYRQLKNRITRKLFGPWFALVIALATKSDIYHYHDPEFMFIGFVLRWLFRKKVIFDIHEPIAKQIMNKGWLPKFSRKPISLLYKPVEKVFTCGQALVLANLGSVPDYPPSAYLVRNYPLYNEELVAKARQIKKDPQVPLLVYIGGVAIIRGAEVYVELAGKLAERGHKFRMMIIGQDHEHCVEKLNYRIKRLNLTDNVLFTGRLNYNEVMEYVSNATIGLCLLLPTPNYTLALSTKILEYMMLGVPVLASDFDCWREFVEGVDSGRMVTPCDIDKVTDVCEEMLADPDELENMGRRGMKAIKNKYNWSSEFEVLLRCYRNLLQ